MNKPPQVNDERRQFLTSSAVATIGFGFWGSGLQALGALANNHALTDEPGTHNMLVVGERTVFLSHLPMFDGLNRQKTDFTSPHRYQVILEATFTDGKSDLTGVYTADRGKNQAVKMYTFNPAPFVLPNLDPFGGSPLRSFRGNAVFRGHLERGGQSIIGDGGNPPPAGLFDVNVARVVHFHKFVPGGARPKQLQYILFGKGSETFLAHFISAPPDFDQIISVRVTGRQFADDELGRGIEIGFAGRANSAKTRIKETEKASAAFVLSPGGVQKPLTVEVVREFYFEEGELFMPPTFDPTAEEKKSGFGD